MTAKTRTQRLEARHAKKARGEAINTAIKLLFAARDQNDAAHEMSTRSQINDASKQFDVAGAALTAAVTMPNF